MPDVLPQRPFIRGIVPDPSKEAPSILRQTKWDCGFYKLPFRQKTQYFNPGLVDWLGARWLVARRRRYAFQPGQNDIVFFRLRGNEEPVNEYQVRFRVRYLDEHWEDPRVILFNGRPVLSYANFRLRFRWVHQGVAFINERFHAEDHHLLYGNNRSELTQNIGHEKNWLWFEHGGFLHFVYSADPHTIVKTEEDGSMREFVSAGFKWSYGVPRGGTPPVYVAEDNLYWSFFHSSLDISPEPPRRRYYMGAYAFEPWPPFRVIMVTKEPFLTGSGEDPREASAPYCVFPCGAILDKDIWTVSLGVNDCNCAWLKVPHQELRRLSYLT